MADIPSLRSLLPVLETGRDLGQEDIAHAVAGLLAPGLEEEPKAAFLTALRHKGETAAEIAGFARALLEHAVDPQIQPGRVPGPLLDVCGTGGDKLDLFNVSTTAMFILAAGGAAVVKHGNRAITSQCGGADVLEALGVRLDLPSAVLREGVERHGLGFLFAPGYHPAFKAIAPVRQRLAAQGIPTIFNLLGPLLNPARPAYQLIGLFSRELLPRYAEAVALLGRERAWVVHGSGMDELSTLGLNDIREVDARGVRELQVDPTAYRLHRAVLPDLLGGNREQNARIVEGILSGEISGAKRELVLWNAAGGFVVCGLAPDLAHGLHLAAEQVESGRAAQKLAALRDWSTAHAKGAEP